MAEDIKITVTFSDKATSNIKKTEKAVKDLSKTTEGAGKSFNDTFTIIKGVVGGAGVIGAFNLAKNAAKDLFRVFVTDGVKAAQVQEDAINQLNIALAASGRFSKEASQDLQDYASALQKTTRFGDEAIIQTQALIQSLGQLDQEGLKKATAATLDLSAALGVDLNAAALLVGKAASGEVSSFSRYGLVIQKGADASETFAKALDAINSRFGGAAAGQVNTFSGAVEQSNNIFGDLQEAFGFTITKNQAFISSIKEVSVLLSELGEFIKNNEQALKEGLAQGLITAIDFTAAFNIALQALIIPIDLIVASIRAVGNSLAATASAAVSVASGDFKGAFETIKLGAQDVKNEFAAVGDSPALDKVTEALARVRGAAVEGFNAVKSGAESGVEPTNALVDATAKLAAEQENLAQKNLERIALENELLASQKEAQLITEEEFLIKREELLFRELAAKEKLSKDAEIFKIQEATAFNKLEAQKTAFAQKQEQQRAANLKSTLGTISSLQSSSSKELFAIGQAAAVAQATIDGFAAVQKALTAAPPPFNFALAALVGVASGANIAKIVSAKPPKLATGLEEVPSGFSNDTFPAFLQSGEGVIRSATNTRFERIADQNELLLPLIANGLAGISAKLDSVGANFKVNANVDGLFEVIRDGQESGRVLG